MTPNPLVPGNATGLTASPAHATDGPAVCGLSPQFDMAAVQGLIEASEQAFAGDGQGAQRYVFVVKSDQQVIGVAALDARLGLDLPRYSFRTGVVVHASRELAMFQQAATLVLGNDTTGATELILPVMAAGAPMASVHLLLDTLLQWVVQAPQRFGTSLVCTLPGQCDGLEQPIFWQALGRHFYAGALPVDNPLFRSPLRSHMGRLMPKHPIYSSLLTAEGQSSLGHCAASALPLQQWLMAVGFRYRQQIDIVDGGPILERDLV